MINIYFDNPHSALKYFKNTEANLYNVLVMAGDFNIEDSDWNSSYLFYSIHSNTLFDIANSFSLKLSHSVQQIFMRYSDNDHDSNLVINLIFLYPISVEINNNNIFPKLHYPSDHALLMDNFISKLIKVISTIDISSISNKESLKLIVKEYARMSEVIWHKFSHCINITKYSKA